jgi:hypothetical protein
MPPGYSFPRRSPSRATPPARQATGPPVAANVDFNFHLTLDFSPKQEWLDRDFLKIYAQDEDDSVGLDEVRQALSKIPRRLADDIRAERDQR